MKRYALGAFLLIIGFILVTLTFFSFIKSKDFEKRMIQTELEANDLREEVIRLQKIAIEEAARARAVEADALRFAEEAHRLQKELTKCNDQ